MADELGFHGLTAWFAPEYESRYSSVWAKCGGQLKSLEEADLAVVSDENSIAGTGATSERRMAIRLLRPDRVQGPDQSVHLSYTKFKKVFPAIERMDSSKIRPLAGRAALATSHVARFPAPPRPTSLPFAATTPIVPQQSPVSTEMSCDDESLVPFVPSQVSEKLERLEDYCARLCGLDLSTKNQLETALAEARTGFTLVDLFDDARRWDVRRNED